MKRVTLVLAAGILLLAPGVLPTIRATAQSPAVVTDDNLDQSIANAKTPADHEAIAAYYDQEAASAKAKAALHHNTAKTYEKLNIAKPVGMVNMCKEIAAYWDKVARNAEDLAKAHREMAKAGTGTAQ